MSNRGNRRLGVGAVLAILGISVILLHTAVTGAVFSISASRSAARWESRLGEVIRESLVQELRRLAAIREGLTADGARDILSRRMESSRFAVVFDTEGRLLYWYVAGESWVDRGIPVGPASYDAARRRLAQLLAEHPLDGRSVSVSATEEFEADLIAGPMALPVENYRGELYGTLVAGAVDLGGESSAGALFASALTSLIAAVLTAAGVGLAVVLYLAAAAERATRALASSLEALAGASYNGEVPRFRILQFDRIAESASTLASALAREHELRVRWVRNIAHDLKTPVAALRAQFSGISEGVLPATPERISRLDRQLTTVEELIADFMLLTRLEAPEFSPKREKIAPRELLHAMRRRFGDLFEAQGRVFRTAATGELPNCHADRWLLERALANLIENARVHGHGEVALEASGTESTILYTVTNGGEIEASILDTITEPSVRGEPSTAGHGLGLSIAKAVATTHGGTLAIACREDRVLAELRLPCGPAA